MAFGDEKDGTLFLWDVPRHLREPQDQEEENIANFWKREVEKCQFVIEQQENKREEFNNSKQEADKQKVLEELARDVTETMVLEKEEEEEDAFQLNKMAVMNKLKIISDDDYQAYLAERKKKN